MINLTESAATYLKSKLEDPLAGVRFAVKGGGCSGFEYDVKIEHKPRVFDLPKRGDKIFISQDVRIVVDQKSLLFLDGCSVDWKEFNLGHQLVFNNPNSTGTCGCGISFAV
jgi:iron-sulfur cluster assembly accessory protein